VESPVRALWQTPGYFAANKTPLVPSSEDIDRVQKSIQSRPCPDPLYGFHFLSDTPCQLLHFHSILYIFKIVCDLRFHNSYMDLLGSS
jgi:hypothetical protein